MMSQIVADRVDGEPPVLFGLTSSELLMVSVASAGVVMPTVIFLGAMIGKIQYGLAVAGFIFIGATAFGAKIFRVLKRGRPEGYYQVLVAVRTQRIRKSGPFCLREGPWDTGRCNENYRKQLRLRAQRRRKEGGKKNSGAADPAPLKQVICAFFAAQILLIGAAAAAADSKEHSEKKPPLALEFFVNSDQQVISPPGTYFETIGVHVIDLVDRAFDEVNEMLSEKFGHIRPPRDADIETWEPAPSVAAEVKAAGKARLLESLDKRGAAAQDSGFGFENHIEAINRMHAYGVDRAPAAVVGGRYIVYGVLDVSVVARVHLAYVQSEARMLRLKGRRRLKDFSGGTVTVYDSGRTAPLKGKFAEAGSVDKKDLENRARKIARQVRAFASEIKRRRQALLEQWSDPSGQWPMSGIIRTDLTLGETPNRPLGRDYFGKPFFIVGTEQVSAFWAIHHKKRLLEEGAIGFICWTDSHQQIAGLIQTVNNAPPEGELVFKYYGVHDLIDLFGLTHYPALVTGKEVFQQ